MFFYDCGDFAGRQNTARGCEFSVGYHSRRMNDAVSGDKV